MFRMTTGIRSLAFFAAILILQFAVPSTLLAAEVNLDLKSNDRTISASTIDGLTSATIKTGGSNRTVTGADYLTPAEFVAVNQVLSGGLQTIRLNGSGVARSGSFVLTPEIAGNLGNLILPNNITAVQNLALLPSLNLSGDLVNKGKLFAISTDSAFTSANISATNIFNNTGATLASLSGAKVGGITGGAWAIDLNLNALGQIFNAGRIASSGNLTMSAPQITNTSTGVVQALNNLNLVSPSIMNAGLMSSVANNVNVTTAQIQNILINNVGGTIQALQGDINIRDSLFAGKGDAILTGGNWLSKELNINSTGGLVEVNVEAVNGVVNATAHDFHLATTNSSLTTGDLIVTGDPRIAVSGDYVISSDINFSEDTAIIATGTISTTAAVTSIQVTGAGNSLLLLAGRFWEFDGGNVKVSGEECYGGDIDFTASPTLTVSTEGGRILMVATGGAAYKGFIHTNSNAIINSAANSAAEGGDISILAGTTGRPHYGKNFNLIELGDVTSIGTASSTDKGNILIKTAFAEFNTGELVPGAGDACPGCLLIDGFGTLVGDSLDVVSIEAGDLAPASMLLGNITGAAGSTKIELEAGHNLLVNGNVLNNGIGAGAGGDITIASNVFNLFNIDAAETLNGVTGTIETRGGLTGGAGGDIAINIGGKGGINVSDLNSITSGVSTDGSGNAGNIEIISNQRGITLGSTGVLRAQGGTANGAGGEISITAPFIVGSGVATLSATGQGSGDGGSVNLTTTSGGTGDIIINNVGNAIFVVVNPTGTGNGGTLNVDAGRDVNLNTNGLVIGPAVGSNGDGGNVALRSGATAPDSDVLVTGSLNMDGDGTGSGGSVAISSNSNDSLEIGGATTNGVTGTISANSGATGGIGGEIAIESRGPGAININNNVNANGFAGGGEIAIEGPQVDLNGNNLSAMTTGATGDGGAIAIETTGPNGIIFTSFAQFVITPGASGNGGDLALDTGNAPLVLPAGTMNVSGTTNGDGGAIALKGSTIQLGGTVNLIANGSGTGSGGGVAIETTDNTSAGDINVNTSEFTIQANSGATSGDGGVVELISGHDVNINATFAELSARAVGAGDGSGGTYEFRSGTEGSTQVTKTGTFTFTQNGTGNGDGGDITISNNFIGDINIDGYGNITANGIGNGDGGSITVENNAGSLSYGDTTTIQANAGATSGNGGEIKFNAHHDVGGAASIDFGSGYTNLSASASAGGGDGGTIEFKSDFGSVDLDAGTFNLSGTGASGSGGTFKVTGTDLTIGGVVTVNARGSATGDGDGGEVSISLSEPTSEIHVEAGALAIDARQGLNNGDGGKVTLKAGRLIEVDSQNNFLQAAATAGSGNGAEYDFTAGGIFNGVAYTGNLQITGNLPANGVGTGDGGKISLVSSSGDVLDLSSGGGSQNFWYFSVSPSANGGAGGGAGGTILFENKQAGGIFYGPTTLSANANGDGFDGGSITIRTPGQFEMSFFPSSINANGSGTTAGGSGGDITIDVGTVNFFGLALNAAGAYTGDGGSVSVKVSNLNADLNATGFPNDINSINVSGGPAGLVGGDGGTVILSAGKNLNVDMSIINAATSGLDGAGPTFDFTAGSANKGTLSVVGDIISTAGTQSAIDEGGSAGSVSLTNLNGNIFVDGNISITSTGQNDGGTVSIICNSTDTFSVGSGSATNGINGSITVVSGDDPSSSFFNNVGDGGTVSISNLGPGGITILDGSEISITVAQNGAGGVLSLSATQGGITLGGGTFAVNGQGSDPDNALCCAGGTITMTSKALFLPDSSAVTLQAEGLTGDGGNITITLTGAGSSLNIGHGAHQLELYASAGVSPSGFVLTGGTFDLSANGNIYVDPTAIDGNSLGADAGGANISLKAENIANDRNWGRVYIDGNFTQMNGVGAGAGGNLTIITKSETPFSIMNGAALNGVNGYIEAIGGGGFGDAASGGNVSIRNSGTGGIRLGAFFDPITRTTIATINADAGSGGGNGGSIELLATGQQILFEGGAKLQSNATCGTGANVTIEAARLANIVGRPAGTLFIEANAAGDFAGGVVNISTTDLIDVIIGNGKGQINVSATGGEVGSLGGGGGTLNISSGKGVTINTNALNLNQLGDGDGAHLSVTTGVSSLFKMVGAVGSFDIDGIGHGDGGTLDLNLGGTATIKFDGVQVIPTSANAGQDGGNGGTISIITKGALQFVNSTIQARASGGATGDESDYNGGTILFEAVKGTMTGNTNLFAHGTDFGNGGTVDLKYNGSVDIKTGTANGRYEIAAPSGNMGGDGGTINLSTLAGITASQSSTGYDAAPQGPNGNGANLGLVATKLILINGNLSANGVGNGDGGSINIEYNGSSAFKVNINTTNGVTGNISANGGTEGSGGTITFEAPTGILSLNNASIRADGNGSEEANGGTVEITVNELLLTGTLSSILSAQGNGIGDGGTMNLLKFGIGALVIGTAAKQLEIDVTGGSAGSRLGDGGDTQVDVGGALTINNTGGYRTGPVGDDGNGADIIIGGGAGKLFIDGSLSANGVGVGNGGTIALTSDLATGAFNIGISALTTHGVDGNVTANSGVFGGDAGIISIGTVSTTGLVFLNSNNVQANALNGGDGGTIALSALTGKITFQASLGRLEANGSGNGDGGIIQMIALSYVGPTTSNFTIAANASGTGDGGIVRITSSSTAALTLGSGSGQFILEAMGGSSGATSGDGGTISVTNSLGNLNVNAGGLNFGPQGVNGNGGKLTLSSGNLLFANTSLDASGVGVGNGGTIELNATKASNSVVFNVGNPGVAFTQGVDGSLSATAGGTIGNGGTISIIYNGTKGVTLNNFIDVSANNGDGGSITVITQTGTLTLNTSSVIANGDGFQGDGGRVNLQGKAVLITPGVNNVTLSASAFDHANGGFVEIQNGGTTGTIIVDDNPVANSFQLFASGHNGRGGSVTVGTNAILSVDGNGIDISIGGTYGNGGTIDLRAKTSMLVTNNLIADGNGYGNGGTVRLTYTGSSVFVMGGAITNGLVGQASASSGNDAGDGGSVFVNAAKGLTYNAGSIDVSTNGDGGKGGSIFMAAGSGVFTFNNNLPSVDGSGSFTDSEGGSIFLSGLSMVIPGGFSLSADGSGIAKGGIINVAFGTMPTVQPGTFDVSAQGGVINLFVPDLEGQGGTVNLNATANLLTVDGDAINVGQSSYNGGVIDVSGAKGVTLNDDISSGFGLNNRITVTAGGSSPILTPFSNTIFGSRVTLRSTSGTIGTSLAPIFVDTPELTIASGGGVFVANVSSGPLNVRSASAKTLFIGTDNDLITTGTVSATNVTLVSTFGDIILSSNITGPGTSNTVVLDSGDALAHMDGVVKATTITLNIDGDIGTFNNPLAISANAVTGSNTLNLNASNNSTFIWGSRAIKPIFLAGGNFNDLELVAGGSMALPISLTSANDMLLGATDISTLTAATLTVKFALNANNITLLGGAIIGPGPANANSVSFESVRGNIGSPFQVNSNVVSANTLGTVNILAPSGNIILTNSTAGNSMLVKSNSDLNVMGNIYTGNGKMTLQSVTGTLTIDDSTGFTYLKANNGDLFINNLDPNGDIVIGTNGGNGVDIETFATGTLGAVRIFVGTKAGTPTNNVNPTPGTLNVVSNPANLVFFGTNSITNNGTFLGAGQGLEAKGTQLQFNAGASANNITLENTSFLYILADPVPAAPSAPRSMPVVSSHTGSMGADVVSTGSGVRLSAVTPVSFGGTTATFGIVPSDTTRSVAAPVVAPSVESVTTYEDESVNPVGFGGSESNSNEVIIDTGDDAEDTVASENVFSPVAGH